MIHFTGDKGVCAYIVTCHLSLFLFTLTFSVTTSLFLLPILIFSFVALLFRSFILLPFLMTKHDFGISSQLKLNFVGSQ
jgi:hypothetical protein